MPRRSILPKNYLDYLHILKVKHAALDKKSVP